MIVEPCHFEDLENLVLFDEYRQFYGASSNLSLPRLNLQNEMNKA